MKKAPREHFLTLTQDMPEFFPDGAPETVAEVFMTPIELPFAPFDMRGMWTGTMLGGLRARKTRGSTYDDAALLFMEKAMNPARVAMSASISSTKEGRKWHRDNRKSLPNSTWLSAMHESRIQHELMLRSNDRATEMLENDATPVTKEEAEELMQIRSGIASLPSMFRFLALHPDVGRVEFMKATVPFDPRAALIAHSALTAVRNGFGTQDELDISIKPVNEKPERLHIEPSKDLQDAPDPRIMVFKTRIAQAAVTLADGNVFYEDIIRRDSGVILHPRYGDDMTNSYYELGDSASGSVQHAAPITITAYVGPSKVAPEAPVE